MSTEEKADCKNCSDKIVAVQHALNAGETIWVHEEHGGLYCRDKQKWLTATSSFPAPPAMAEPRED